VVAGAYGEGRHGEGRILAADIDPGGAVGDAEILHFVGIIVGIENALPCVVARAGGAGFVDAETGDGGFFARDPHVLCAGRGEHLGALFLALFPHLQGVAAPG